MSIALCFFNYIIINIIIISYNKLFSSACEL